MMNQIRKPISVTVNGNTEMPSISIVIPTYNRANTLARTLQSLITQNYPNLEIIVVDGGSTDNSLDIIKQYEKHINWWISEKDRGQSEAINKGFSHCSGQIVNWLCSDDVLTPNALHIIGEKFKNFPDVDIVVGSCLRIYINENNRQYVSRATQNGINLMPAANVIGQASCFYKRSLLRHENPIDISYNFAMDFELWNYFKTQNVSWKCIENILSIAFEDGQNKSLTGGEKIVDELERIYKTYTHEPIPLTFWHRKLRYPLEIFSAHHPNPLWLFIIAPIWVLVGLFLMPFYGCGKVWAMRWRIWARASVALE